MQKLLLAPLLFTAMFSFAQVNSENGYFLSPHSTTSNGQVPIRILVIFAQVDYSGCPDPNWHPTGLVNKL